jgi:iron complex outermembrane receptor protein
MSLALATVMLLAAEPAARAPESPPPPPPHPFETVVTAPPPQPALPREDSAASASVVVPAASARAYDDLTTLLLEVPGVVVTRTGSIGAYATLALRGSSPDEVRVYVDGVPLNLAEGGGVDISTLPVGDVERVEVYRGSSPLAFGGSALGGIVSIVTRTPGTPYASARAGVASFGTAFGDLAASGRAGRVRLYAGAHGLATEGHYPLVFDNATPTNPADDIATVRTNNDVEQLDGVVRAVADLPGRRTLGLGIIGFGRNQGLPGSNGRVSTRFVRSGTTRALAYARYDSRDDLGPGGRLTALLYAAALREVLRDPDGELNEPPTSTRDTTLSGGARADASAPLAWWARLAAVAEARAESFQPVDQAAATPAVGVPARRLSLVGGVETDLWLRPIDLHLVPSARLEVARDVVAGRDPLLGTPRPADAPITRALPVLRLALVRPFGEAVTVKANLGRYARVPSFYELYGDGYGSYGRTRGNPSLLPERGSNADLGLWLDGARGRWRVSSRTTAFGARVDDLIAWVVGTGIARAENVADARVLGAEQELRLGVGRHLGLVAQATVTDARAVGGGTSFDGRQLPFHPRYHGYGRAELMRVAVGRGLELAAFADADWRGRSYQDAANVIEVPARLLVGVGLSATVPRWRLRLTASGQNLTDSRALDVFYQPLPGRALFVALAWSSAVDEPGTGTIN